MNSRTENRSETQQEQTPEEVLNATANSVLSTAETQELLIGKKVGEIASGKDPFKLEIMEIYREAQPQPVDIKFDNTTSDEV